MSAPWQDFERAVAVLCQALAPDAKVTHDAKTLDVDIGSRRQRDVWIEALIGGHFPVKILVSCKRYARKVTVQQVDAFLGELGSSGANMGVIYSASGFTKDALAKAKARGISACVLLTNQPPPIPAVLLFDAYFLDERIQLVATGLTGAVDWKALLNADTTIEGETLPVHRALAAAFASDLPALQDAVGEKAMPVRVNMVTLAEADGIEPVRVGVQSQWAIFRARTEAWLVNGSYNFTGEDFKGSIATPSIDTWSSDPGPGWEPIPEDEINGGNTIKFYRFLQDSRPAFAAMASGALAISDHQSAMS